MDLEKIKLYELEIMDEIHRICENNNIKYSLMYGTLIGAIRHSGFIPWDDDIDIAIEYDDYSRFVTACERELDKERFFLQTSETDKEYNNPLYIKVRRNGTVLMEGCNSSLKNMNHGVWVDIFLLHSCREDYRPLNKFYEYYKVWYAKKYFKPFFKDKNFKGKIKLILDFFKHPYSERIARNKMLKVISSIDCKDGDYLYDPQSSIKCLYSKKDFSEIGEIRFENRTYYCIKNYDKYLSKIYGNYMELPPVNERKTNHQFCKVIL